MENNNIRAKQIIKFLNWTRRYSGWWYLICTPNDENMNPKMIKRLIEELAQNSFYEIIFVLIMVHRNESYVDNFIKSMFLEMITSQWDDNSEEIIKKFTDHFK